MAGRKIVRIRTRPGRTYEFVLFAIVITVLCVVYFVWENKGGQSIIVVEASERSKITRSAERQSVLVAAGKEIVKPTLSAEAAEEEELRRCGWKPNESLAGFCSGNPLAAVSPKNGKKGTAAECSASCCASKKCVAWQFREDVGCLQGPDVRLGMEKDGTPEWCEPTAPSRWHGEKLTERHEGKPTEEVTACGDDWNPDALTGQCFGLGGRREDFNTPDECRKACCEDSTCETWQFREDKGCFFGQWIGHCEPHQEMGPFVGRRKLVKGRSYTDHKRDVVHPVTPWPGLPSH